MKSTKNITQNFILNVRTIKQNKTKFTTSNKVKK